MDPRLQTDYLYQGVYKTPIAKTIKNCEDCDGDIFEGEDYYDINGHIICCECISDYKHEAEDNTEY